MMADSSFETEGAPEPAAAPAKPASTKKKWIMRFVNVAIILATFFFIYRHMAGAYAEFQEKKRDIDYSMVAASGAIYILGLLILGLPWGILMRTIGVEPNVFRNAMLYTFSHVGKYVPGKAIVIVIRCKILGRRGIPAVPVVVTSFHETFMTMASGALISLVYIFFFADESLKTGTRWYFPWVTLALAGAFFCSVIPAIFRFAASLIALPIAKSKNAIQYPVTMKVVVFCLVLGTISWFVQGYAYLLTLRSILPEPIAIAALPTVTSALAMSIVLGFVSMMPGQLGVREVVLIEIIKAYTHSELTAVGGAILFRLVTVASELIAASILWWRIRK